MDPSDIKTHKIRHPTWFELPAMAKLMALAFYDNELFGDFMHTRRHEYPQDMYLYWLRTFQKHYFDSRHVFLIITDLADTGKESIVGAAQWERCGNDAGVEKFGWSRKWWDPRRTFQPLATLYTKIQTFLNPSRALDPNPARKTALFDSDPFCQHHWTGLRASTWYLHYLAVHPNHNSRGHGRNLVSWGMQRSRIEGISCSVVSAKGKERFYQRCGFDQHVGRAGDGLGNPLADVEGGEIFFWDYKSDQDDVAGEGEGEGGGVQSEMRDRKRMSKIMEEEIVILVEKD